jgi:hypothetical protein
LVAIYISGVPLTDLMGYSTRPGFWADAPQGLM